MLRILVHIFVIALAGVVFCLPRANDENSDRKPGYCYLQGLEIKDGDTVPAPIGTCGRVTCKVDAETGHFGVMGVGCGEMQPAKGCHMSKTDLTKRYPDCCPKHICPE